jgi:hypothetical protein
MRDEGAIGASFVPQSGEKPLLQHAVA